MQGNPAWLLIHMLHMLPSLLSCLGAAKAQAGGTNSLLLRWKISERAELG